MSDSRRGCIAYKPEISYWLLVIYLAIGISYNRDFINRNFIYTVSDTCRILAVLCTGDDIEVMEVGAV